MRFHLFMRARYLLCDDAPSDQVLPLSVCPVGAQRMLYASYSTLKLYNGAQFHDTASRHCPVNVALPEDEKDVKFPLL